FVQPEDTNKSRLEPKFYSSVHYKSIYWCINITKLRMAYIPGVDGVKAGLPSVQEIFKVKENGKMLTKHLLGHQTHNPIGLSLKSIVEQLGRKVISFQTNPEIVMLFKHQDIVQPMPGY